MLPLAQTNMHTTETHLEVTCSGPPHLEPALQDWYLRALPQTHTVSSLTNTTVFHSECFLLLVSEEKDWKLLILQMDGAKVLYTFLSVNIVKKLTLVRTRQREIWQYVLWEAREIYHLVNWMQEGRVGVFLQKSRTLPDTLLTGRPPHPCS